LVGCLAATPSPVTTIVEWWEPQYKVLSHMLKLKLFSSLKSSKTLNALCLVHRLCFSSLNLQFILQPFREPCLQ
jgi:hypothetical protein